ncbi:MAG: beta-lactamase-like protein [Monoraphidium minutum]|nr:MAG: beta-lactamase-like protein [Monoraphidium minutum]
MVAGVATNHTDHMLGRGSAAAPAAAARCGGPPWPPSTGSCRRRPALRCRAAAAPAADPVPRRRGTGEGQEAPPQGEGGRGPARGGQWRQNEQAAPRREGWQQGPRRGEEGGGGGGEWRRGRGGGGGGEYDDGRRSQEQGRREWRQPWGEGEGRGRTPWREGDGDAGERPRRFGDGGRGGGGRGRGAPGRYGPPRGGGAGGGYREHGRRGGAPPAPPAPPPPPPPPESGKDEGFPYFYGYGTGQKWHLPTALAVTWLGTSSGTPTRDRNISCTLLRTPRGVFMVDCGEGSLAQLRKTGLDAGHVDAIFVTHLHGDHCFGLASMVAAAAERRAARLAAAGGGGGGGGGGGALRVFGPPGLSELLRAQMVLTGLQRELALPLLITEFVEEERLAHGPQPLNEAGTVLLSRQAPERAPLAAPRELKARLVGAGIRHLEDPSAPRSYVQNDYKARPGLVWRVDGFDTAGVTAAQLQHRLPCWGYVFDEKLPADADGAALYDRLHAHYAKHMAKGPAATLGDAAADGGGEDDSDAPLAPLAPRRVVILGDTMDSAALAPACVGADLLSHEATYSRGMEHKALRAQHSTAWMAGQFARAVGARALVLTHFSARYKSLSAGDGGDNSDGDGGEGGGGGGGARRSHWARGAEVEADQGTLQSLIGEAVREFGSSAVCTAKDLFTVHVGFKTRVEAASGEAQGEE